MRKKLFSCFFFISQFGFSAKLSGLLKKHINGWKHFLPRVPSTFVEKKFHQIFFFRKIFRTLNEKFPDVWRTFDRQGLQNSIFFCQRNFVTRNNFLKVNEITIKNFCPPTVSFLYFWWEGLAGVLEFNYSCPDELSEKNHLFHNISYFHESFRTLGEKSSKLCPTLFFGSAIEKATYVSRGSL